MEPIFLTKAQARKIILNAAGLARKAQFGEGIEAVKLSKDVFILSPFDILNVFRHRLKDFFDFDYQIECFVPAAKRKYGYFSLPVLSGDIFIARMDAKADRKQKVLIIHNLHFEPIDIDQITIEKFIQALKAFILFNQCRNIIFKKSNNETYLEAINKGFFG